MPVEPAAPLGAPAVARSTRRQKRTDLRRARRAAPHAGAEAFAGLSGFRSERRGRLAEESEVEVGLGAGRHQLDLVEGVLVAEVLVAGRHRALLDDVVDARHDAVGSHLALAEAHQRLDLAREAVAGGQHRMLTTEVLGLPVQHVAEQHGGLVVEVVAGDEHVEAAVDRRLVEQVTLRQAARRTRRALAAAVRRGDVVAVLRRAGRSR